MKINENDVCFDKNYGDLRETIVLIVAGAEKSKSDAVSNEDAMNSATATIEILDPALLILQRVVCALERIADAQEARRNG